jgi:predicted nucleic acid-binding protein
VILYLDTSSLMKLFVQEEGSRLVEALVEGSQGAAISLVGYPEARAALARVTREGRLTKGEHRRALRRLEEAWADFIVIAVDEALIRLAGALAEKHFLRGFDSIHLASALSLQQQIGETITFSAAETRLSGAARVEGLALPQ